MGTDNRSSHSDWLQRLDYTGKRVAQIGESGVMRTALDELGSGPVRWAVDAAHRNADQILQEVPSLGTGPLQAALVRQGTELVALITLLELHGVTVPDGMPTVERRIIADFVHRRVPIEDVWRGNRASHQWWQQELFEVCDRLCEPTRRGGESQRIAQTTLGVFNALSTRINEAFIDESKRWVSTQTAIEDEAVRKVLSDDFAGDEGQVAEVLRYDFTGWSHMAAIAWIADERAATSDLHGVAEGYLRELGATKRVAIRQGGALAWAWGSFRSDPGSAPWAAISEPPDGVRVAFGALREGLDGFRQSHVEAQKVYQLAVGHPSINGQLLNYRSLGLVTLLLENPQAAERFAVDLLGDLFGPEIRLRELRDTLLVYIETRSPQAVAHRIHVARNTVGYRIRQAEGILGFTVLERPSELWCALVIADALTGPDPANG
ncbi:PucR family transcriptional regulator [Dietzia aurantiaca]|uniref:PucR family transcriptional regulator n=1 Tax=Dietzia aurantiaca TaxID=983873 RepID=A0ABV9PTW7_9ACTN